MDHVYMVRPGENEELRYSLRSLDKHVPHDNVWIIGGWPDWVSNVETIELPYTGDTSENIQVACANKDISDPFVLWMDDIYVTEPVDEIPILHNGPMSPRSGSSTWVRGYNSTSRWLRENVTQSPLSYELHVPLVVHKGPMLVALARLREIPTRRPHKRSVYGNLSKLDGVYARDSKVTNPRATIDGPWLSSADATFVSSVFPRLGMLNTPSRFER